jgi:phosphoglycolate phosphatase
MSNKYKLIMFDLDGTLVETALEICDAVNDTFKHFGLGQVQQKQVNDWIGHGTRELIIQALAHLEQVPAESIRGSDRLKEIFEQFDPFYKARCGTRSHLYPHVREVLQELKAQGTKLAIVTNKEGRHTQTLVKYHQLDVLMDVVISGDTFPTKKPDPVGIHHCLQQYGVRPEEALFVGDSSIDAATAKNAGVEVWLLPYGYNLGQPVADCHPDRLIDDFSALR